MSRELSCKELVELVTEYLEDALTERDRQDFEEHLAGCEGCAVFLDSIRRTIEVTGRLTEEDVPSEFQSELLAAFRGWRT